MAFLRRRVVTAALTSNALRPLPGFHPGGLSFIPGWLAGELAPHLLVFTAADTAYSLARRRASGPGLAVAAATAGGLAYLIRQGLRTGRILEDALGSGLGEVAELDPPELAIPWRTLINPFDHRDARVRVDRDVVFTEAGRRGMLDIYRPAGRDVSAAPVLLQVHGGGWVLGRKDQQGVPLMQHMAAKGWVVVAINYRLAPRNAFPAQIIDVKKAIAWIRNHIAEYGGDPDYVRRIEDEIRSRKLEDDCRIVKIVPYEQMPALYRTADVAVSVPFSDATPMSLLEAMATGLVPVCSDLPSLREWITDDVNGFLVPADDPDAIATQVLRALDGSPHIAAFAARNRLKVEERASQRAHMSRMAAAYDSLMTRSRGMETRG